MNTIVNGLKYTRNIAGIVEKFPEQDTAISLEKA